MLFHLSHIFFHHERLIFSNQLVRGSYITSRRWVGVNRRQRLNTRASYAPANDADDGGTPTHVPPTPHLTCHPTATHRTNNVPRPSRAALYSAPPIPSHWWERDAIRVFTRRGELQSPTIIQRVCRDEGGARERHRRWWWRWRSQVGDTNDEEKVCRARVEFVAFTAECGDSGDKFGRSSCYSSDYCWWAHSSLDDDVSLIWVKAQSQDQQPNISHIQVPLASPTLTFWASLKPF